MSQKIAKRLLEISAVCLSPQKPFTWASGIQSPIYCDNRLILSYPKIRDEVVREFLKMIRESRIRFDVIAGIATGGIPMATLLADRLKKPMIYVRSQPKSHGKGNQVEGAFKKGARVLVIEDLVSTGMSSLNAIHALRDAGAQVTVCLAVFTYGFSKAAHAFEEADCRLLTLTRLSELLPIARKLRKISLLEQTSIQKFALNH